MDPFVAEIRIYPFSFPPKGWAFCNGQLLPISQNTALFSLIGTFYGGDGKSTFGLPDFQGSVPLSQGQGPGLSLYVVGEVSGVEAVTLLQTEMPSHQHSFSANAVQGDTNAPSPGVSLARSTNATAYQSNTSQNLVLFSDRGLTPVGASLPHNNLQPYLTLNFCIALQGVYPSRS